MRNYDPSEVSVIVGGHIVTGGVESADFCSVARDEEAYTYTPDISGGGTRSKNPNKAGKVTIRLQASSPSNAFLSGLAQQDEESNSGIVPVLVRDNNGLDLHKGEQAYIVKKPDANYGKAVGDREYVLQVEKLFMNSGGSAE